MVRILCATEWFKGSIHTHGIDVGLVGETCINNCGDSIAIRGLGTVDVFEGASRDAPFLFYALCLCACLLGCMQ